MKYFAYIPLCEYINWFENYKKKFLCLLIKIQWFCNRSLSYRVQSTHMDTGLDRFVIEVIPVLFYVYIYHDIKSRAYMA